jgi:hypothetical protein
MSVSDAPSGAKSEKLGQGIAQETEYSQQVKDEESSRDASSEDHPHANKASVKSL